MQSISMLELRQNAERVLSRLLRGERLQLTYRGKPVATLEPDELIYGQ
jgi:antitoxin (DNA-binding transcriptional repressor) of toxin-antitoxin stability system